MTNPTPTPIPDRPLIPRTSANRAIALLSTGSPNRRRQTTTNPPHPPRPRSPGELADTAWRLDRIRDIQDDRAERQRRKLNDAAARLEFHKNKGIPWHPPIMPSFVFSKEIEIERVAKHKKDLNASHHIEYVFFDMPPSSAKLFRPAGHDMLRAC